ncbi:MAG TPA: class I tRNA ligase family protein, partial [Gaiellaceae bacterium]|nr:class I tRNA ligase family protein [Gaiellaceae bacterium]
SLSQHELSQSGVYQEKSDPSVFVRFPLLDRDGESVVIWTTTPWTLPANVAAAVNPEGEYGRRENGEWVLAERFPEDTFVQRAPGSELVGLRYEGPFDTLAPGASVEHRIVPWDEVSMEEGTGIVHIATGCGPEDFELGKSLGLPVLTPVDEAGHFYDNYGWLHGLSTVEAADQIVGDLSERGFLVTAGTYLHNYAHCWRCDTPIIYRLSDDWFIAVDGVRPRLLEENAEVEWVPDYMGKRMDDWLRNMGDWNISRRRYYGLPLPFYPCACGHLNVVGSKAELEERALEGLEQLQELRRPWIDRVPIRCEACDEPVTRVVEVGDVWLDAGIVPFSTLGWQNPEWKPGGYATGASAGLSGADLPDHAYWEKWFPADWVTEMREQIRLWFYSQFFMSVVLVDRSPYTRVLGYEKMLDETGREMHGSWGNMIDAEDAFEKMGADVMRWQYCAQPPDRNLLFGYGPGHEIKRKLLTFWNSMVVLTSYGNIEQFEPTLADLENGPPAERALDRWLVERTHELVRDATAAYEATLTVDVIRSFEAFVDDLSNWYIRRSRRQFYGGVGDASFRTLWYSLVQSLRVIAPVMPFLAEHLWRNLVSGDTSVFLAGWPETAEPDRGLLDEIALVRRVIALGRQARSASGLKQRQPLRRLVVAGAGDVQGHADEIAEELRVKSVEFGVVEAAGLKVKPNLPVLGPKLGAALREVNAALAEGRFEELAGGRFRVDGHELEANEVLVERVGLDGWAVASEDGLTIALDTTLDDELLLEARLLDLIRAIQVLRKDSGLEVTDRIRLWIPVEELYQFASQIAAETLAVSVELGDELRLEKA